MHCVQYVALSRADLQRWQNVRPHLMQAFAYPALRRRNQMMMARSAAITIGSVIAALLAIIIWFRRRKAGYANACIKCGRTFCHRCKSARESATYCTQCIHIYLKRDGVSLDTKRSKLEEVH